MQNETHLNRRALRGEMNAQGSTPSQSLKGAGRGLAVALLVVGLVIGLGVGYLIAPRPTPPAPENVIETSGSTVHLAVLSGPGLAFTIGGLKNPTVVVDRGANVTVYLRNIDSMPHSFVVVAQGPTYGAEPPSAAFPGAETPMAMDGTMPGENATASFVASTTGTYYYVCHVLGHAAGGMYGKFEVRA